MLWISSVWWSAWSEVSTCLLPCSAAKAGRVNRSAANASEMRMRFTTQTWLAAGSGEQCGDDIGTLRGFRCVMSTILAHRRGLCKSEPGPVTLWRRLLESAESSQIDACPCILSRGIFDVHHLRRRNPHAITLRPLTPGHHAPRTTRPQRACPKA